METVLPRALLAGELESKLGEYYHCYPLLLSMDLELLQNQRKQRESKASLAWLARSIGAITSRALPTWDGI